MRTILRVLKAWIALLLIVPTLRSSAAAPTQVFIDASRPDGAPNAPIRGKAGQEVEVFTLLEQGSSVEFTYWSIGRQNTTTKCRDQKVPEHAVRRSAVPTIAEGGAVRYVSYVGPFRYGVKYCVRITGEKPRPLTNKERKKIVEALGKAMTAIAEEVIKGTISPDVPMRELAEKFATALSGSGLERFVEPGGVLQLSAADALERAATQDRAFKLTLENALRAQTALKDSLRKPILEDVWPCVREALSSPLEVPQCANSPPSSDPGVLATIALIDDPKRALLKLTPDGKEFAEPSLEQFASELRSLQTTESIRETSWQPSYEERFPLYVSADAGVAVGIIPLGGKHPSAAAEVVPYFGLNLYFAAVDKGEHLQWFRREDDDPFGHNFLRRFAVTVGVSLSPPTLTKDRGVSGILRNQLLLTGVGFRLGDYVRLGGGAMLFRKRDPNPLSDRQTVGAAPYVSLSIDVDVIGTIRDWFNKAAAAAQPRG